MNPSWRWEVGAPLVLAGTFISAFALARSSAGLLFWIGIALLALGLVAFRVG